MGWKHIINPLSYRKGKIMAPEINFTKCIKCSLCIKVCPGRAINEEDYSFIDKKCILCLQCMAVCPKEAITFEGKIGNDIDFEKINPASFENLIYKRRSNRNFLDKEIPEEIILKITNLIRYAPTGTNTEEVYITIVPSKEKVKILTDKIMNFFNISVKLFFNIFLYPFWFIILGKKVAKKLYKFKKFINRYYDGENILTYNAPSLFIFHAPKNSSTPAQDCSIWATIGVLYSESLGLGTLFNGFIVIGLNLSKRIKKFLKIPNNHKIYSTFLAGYPSIDYKRNVIRKKAKINII